MDPTQYSSWKTLEQLSKVDLFMPYLFHSDPERFRKHSLEFGTGPETSFLFDYSKNLIDAEILSALLSLLRECGIESARNAMFSGSKINVTEDRAVLHPALRSSPNCPSSVASLVQNELNKVQKVSNMLHCGIWLGHTGKPIRDIVNIGIGGSDLGPRMVCSGLDTFSPQNAPNVHFVSNVDENDLETVLSGIDAETTLFVVVSKTFTTTETMMNAQSAKKWLLKNAPQSAISNHFFAVSCNELAIKEFGIPVDDLHVFKFWDWVGGRYSLWSTVGLSISLRIGFDNFMLLLEGAKEMDSHFYSVPLESNIPMILAALGIWYNNFLGASSYAVLPYENSLCLLPSYLQQADMESNGKSAKIDGSGFVDWQTGPIVWGQAGTNGQHAFYQLIHQGTKLVPCDFIGGINPKPGHSETLSDRKMHHSFLVSNMIAQAEALMMGTCYDPKTFLKHKGEEVHKSFPGNRPSNVFLYESLTPQILGSLIAMYEHKMFVQGVVWGVNSFDQMGVELGKKLAVKISREIDGGKVSFQHDASTTALVNRVIEKKK